jgi:predicted HTH transcriptional regulator
MGGRPDVHDDEEVLSVVRECHMPVVGTAYVADQLGFSTKQGASDRLDKLVEKGLLERGKMSGVKLWWIPDEAVED